MEYPVLDGYQHPPGFAAKRMLRDLEFSEMSQDELKSTWQTVIRNAIQSKSALQDEVTRRTQEDVSGGYLPNCYLDYCQPKSFFFDFVSFPVKRPIM